MKPKALCVCYLFYTMLMFTAADGGTDPTAPSDAGERKFPTIMPASVVANDQCVNISSSAVGKHALNQLYSDVRKRVVNEIVPSIHRSYGRCVLGQCSENPLFSCAELKELDAESQSGLYWLRVSNGSSVKVHCDFDHVCGCSNSNSTPWTRVAFHNMSDPNHNCPFNFKQRKRFCHIKYAGCTSVFFDTLGFTYTNVCGRVLGIQFGEPNAFRPYFKDRERTLEDPYVDGISITHGQMPRTHVWTFVMAEDEMQTDDEGCPCTISDMPFTGVIPPFVGNDYFCDTGSRNRSEFAYYWDDPLWDGAGCGPRSTCCEWQNPPWFCSGLPTPTQNNLEFRVCSDSPSYDELLLLDTIEIYIQ